MNLYPDDHRCSDQETDGGLCGCMMAQSGSEEEEEMGTGMGMGMGMERRNEDDSYSRRLFLARNRKIIQQSNQLRRSSSLDDHASISTNQPNQPLQPTRSVASDPIDQTMDEDEIAGAYPLSSPPHKSRYSPSNSFRASTSRTKNGVQSAARKSISNVYERLLREEEERRESERVRKEQARQKRRMERVRKQEDSDLLARLISNNSLQTNQKEVLEHPDNTQMPPYTSPILAVSPPSTRDASLDLRTSLVENQGADLDHIRTNDHLHPSHAFSRSTNAARIAAVRAANMIEETREGENSFDPSIAMPNLGLAPAFAQSGEVNGHAVKSEEQHPSSSFALPSSPLNASPASSVDSVLSWTFPNRANSPTASPQLLSPNVPDNGSQSSSSPRRNRHRRGTYGEGGVSQVLSLSARVPSLNPVKTAAKVKKELYSPDPDLPLSPGHLSITKEEGEEEESLADGNDRPAPSNGKRRVSFSPKPEFITTFNPVVEENEEEEEDSQSFKQDPEDSLPTIRIPDEINEEVTEGSENSRSARLPLQSTPPRKKRDSDIDRSNNTSTNGTRESIIGDDSLRLTIEQLNKFLKDREEKKDFISASNLLPDDPIKNEAIKTSTFEMSITDLEGASKDEEYVRQLDEARERLNRIARSYTGLGTSSNDNQFATTSRLKIGIFVVGFCAVQIGLAMLMNAAAYAKAEEMYLTMHYGFLGGGGIGGLEEIVFFESQSKSSLFAPLLTQWGIFPDLGRLALGDRDRLMNDWMSTIGWMWKSGRQFGSIWQPIRFTFAKLAYSMGLYEIDTVPLGNIIPS